MRHIKSQIPEYDYYRHCIVSPEHMSCRLAGGACRFATAYNEKLVTRHVPVV